MSAILFDMRLRGLRRDRAARIGPELFLYERVFEDCLDNLSVTRRSFASALLIGCPNPARRLKLQEMVGQVEVREPGALFAAAAGGGVIVEDRWTPDQGSYDLCLAIGTLDTVNDLARAFMTLRFSLKPGGLLIGALAGGETLPQLRAAMRAADEARGAASPHVHPRIEPSALAGLLTSAGFEMPVVDVDRVQVSYRGLDDLVADLRRMGVTNTLSQQSRVPIVRPGKAAAAAAFQAAGDGERTVETFEILHFAAWAGRE